MSLLSLLSQFEFLSFFPFFFLVVSQFEFLSYVIILVFEFCHNLNFWVLSQFEILSFVTVWVFKFCHNFFNKYYFSIFSSWKWSFFENLEEKNSIMVPKTKWMPKMANTPYKYPIFFQISSKKCFFFYADLFSPCFDMESPWC